MSHEEFAGCIDACNDCAVECEHCAAACLREGDVKPLAECIRLDLDCAAVCRLASQLMSRGSKFAREFCRFCATVCDACAAECERHSHQHCRECAEVCRRCAAECRKMAG